MNFILKDKINIKKQIKNQIIDKITSNILKKGTKMPSIRKISKELNISHMTVVKIYNELEKEGYLKKIQGKGTYVKSFATFEDKHIYSGNWQETVKDYLHSSNSYSYLKMQQRKDIEFNFASSQINKNYLPTKKVMDSFIKEIKKNPEDIIGYGDIRGEEKLRIEIAKYMKNQNIKISPEKLIITSGAHQAIYLISRTFLNDNDYILMENPGFSSAIDSFRGTGAKIIPVNIMEDGIDLKELKTKLIKYKPKLIYLVPDNNNPTGYKMSLKKRKDFMKIIEKTKTLVIEDDAWSDIYFDKKLPTLKSLDKYGHVIYAKSFSKVIGGGYRIGSLVADENIFNRILLSKANIDFGNSRLSQIAIYYFFKSNIFFNHTKRLREILKNRLEKVCKLLDELLDPNIKYYKPDGGINLWITLNENLNTNDIYKYNKNISFMSGSMFFPVEKKYNNLKICFSEIDEEKLTTGIIELANTLNNFVKSQGR